MPEPAFPSARFEERRQVVAIVPEPQRDEPPGRGDVRERVVVVVSNVRGLRPEEVETAVVHTVNGRNRP